MGECGLLRETMVELQRCAAAADKLRGRLHLVEDLSDDDLYRAARMLDAVRAAAAPTVLGRRLIVVTNDRNWD